jgi:hypothetical protein
LQKFSLSALLLLSLTSILLTQVFGAVPVQVWGYVRDSVSGEPIVNARVDAIPHGEASVVANSTLTNDRGYFQMEVTGGAAYVFKVTASGYLPTESPVTVTPSCEGCSLPFENIPLQKQPSVGFALRTSPGGEHANVVAGSGVEFRLYILTFGNFSGTIQLGCQSTVTGLACLVNPPSVMLSGGQNGTVTVQVNTSTITPPSNLYELTVVAQSDGLTETAQLGLTVYSSTVSTESTGTIMNLPNLMPQTIIGVICLVVIGAVAYWVTRRRSSA